jgi:pimeloyl-ACP methyl ester carboxylesterase
MTRADAHPNRTYDGDWLSPDHQRIVARGLTFGVTRWHVGADGPPLLFLNGLGANADAAAPLLRRITDRELWTLDMPGTGGSPDCFWPYSAHSMATSVMDVANQLGHHQLDIAGFSWGGALAQQITAQFPDRVGRLILMGTTGHFSAADIGWGAIFDRDVLGGAMNVMKMPVSSALGLTYQSLAITGWNNDRLIPRLIDRPICIMSATHDQVVPASHSDELAAVLHAQCHVKISGGHLFPFTKPEQSAAEILKFLNKDRTAQGGMNADDAAPTRKRAAPQESALA